MGQGRAAVWATGPGGPGQTRGVPGRAADSGAGARGAGAVRERCGSGAVRGLQGVRRPPGGFISPRKELCREPLPGKAAC